MTDNDILEILDRCADGPCEGCPLEDSTICRTELIEYVNALLKRMKKEIEALKYINSNYDVDAEAIRNIAFREFADGLRKRLKKRVEYDEGGWDVDLFTVTEEDIDNLVEEMTEGGDA